MPDIFVGEFSDLSLLISQLQLSRPPVCYVDVSTRAWKGFNEDSFRRELLASGLCLPPAAYSGIPVDELQERYNTTLRALLDKHAPCRTARHRSQPTTPWFDADCAKAKRRTRAFERRYRRSWILIGWSGLDKLGRNNNCSPPNKIRSGRRKFPTARATPRNYGGIFRVFYER